MNGGTEIDYISYDLGGGGSWPHIEGQSAYLQSGSFTATANDDPTVWQSTPADALYNYGGNEYGTPGEANP
jgi:hypothetical protein